MRSATLAILQNLFKIRPEEARLTGLAFTYLFFAIGAFIIGRIARTVLFLEIPDYKQQLPLAYIGIAFSVSISMYLYSRVQGILRRDHTNAITLAVLIAGTVAFRFALGGHNHSVYWAFYFWVEVFGTFLVVQFWTLTNEIFHSRQAKRLFAIIGGGGVLSNIFIGLFVSGAVRALGTENLLYIISGCMAVSLVMVLVLGREASGALEAARDRKPKSRAAGGPVPSRKKALSIRHVQLIALVVVLTYMVSTLVDYQFQAIIGDTIPGKDDRSAYLGNFFAITGIIGGFIQFFITARILERFGLLVALVLLPSFMLLGSASLALAPLALSLAAVTFTKGSENCLRYTINDSTLQLLYLPLPTALRSRAKAFIDGILKPVSIGFAGLCMAIVVGRLDAVFGVDLGLSVSTESFSWAVLVGLCGWLAALAALRREYLKSLLQTLTKRRLNFADANFEINDDATLQTLQQSFKSEQIGEVLHALDLVLFVSGKSRTRVHEDVAELLHHDDEEVRVAALSTLRKARAKVDGSKLAELLEDAAPRVRAAAVLAYAATLKERAIGTAHHLLEDADMRVRASAVAGFVRYGGLDGVLASAERLKSMLGSEDAKERAQAAWVLGEVGVENFYQPLVPLLADENEDVRLAAILAAGKMRPPELVEALIDQLARPRLKRAAITALAAYGKEVEPLLHTLLRDSNTPRTIRAQLPRVLAKRGNPRNAQVLLELIRDPDPDVRNAALVALNHIKEKTPSIRLEPEAVFSAVRGEAEDFFQLLAQERDLALEDKGTLLKDALCHRREQALQRILLVLGLKYPADTIRLVTQNLKSSVSATRANSVEVLDNLLDKREKPLLIPILDDAADDRKLLAGAEHFELHRRDRVKWLQELLASDDPWLQTCAAVAAGEWNAASLEDEVETLLSSPHALCRETAIHVLRGFDRKRLEPHLSALIEDPAEPVRKFALAVKTELAAS